MLVINRNRVVGSEALIDAVWGERARQEARASLHTYVSNLRRLLNDAGVDGRTVLAAAPPGYRLSVPDIDCDIGRFVSEKTAGIRAAAAGQFESASRHLSAALARMAWTGARGPHRVRVRRFVRRRAHRGHVNVHTAHAEAEIACGRANAVIGALEGLTTEHPYREPLWAQLITAYYIAERQSDALDAYRRLKTALSDDLGIEPGPTIRALHGRILRQEVLDVRRAALTAASAAASTLDRRTTATGAPAVARLHGTVGTGPSPDRGGHPDRPACGQRRRARRRRSQPPPRRGQRYGHESSSSPICALPTAFTYKVVESGAASRSLTATGSGSAITSSFSRSNPRRLSRVSEPLAQPLVRPSTISCTAPTSRAASALRTRF